MSSSPHTQFFTQCITELAKTTGNSVVAPTYSPVVSLEVGPLSLVVVHKGTSALLYVPLGILPSCPFFALSVSKLLLDAQVLFVETQGASLGVVQGSGVISLNQQFVFNNSSSGEFVVFAERFLALARYWTHRLETVMTAFKDPSTDATASKTGIAHAKGQNTMPENRPEQAEVLKTLLASESAHPLALLRTFLPPQADTAHISFTPENLLSCIQILQALSTAEIASVQRHVVSQDMADTLHLLAQASEIAKADTGHKDPLATELKLATLPRHLYPLITRALVCVQAMHHEVAPHEALQKSVEFSPTKPTPSQGLCWTNPQSASLKSFFATHAIPTPIEVLTKALTGQKLGSAPINPFVINGIRTLLQQATTTREVFAFLKEAAKQLGQADSEVNAGAEQPFADLLRDQEQYYEEINETYQSVALQLFKDSRFTGIRGTLATAIILTTEIVRPTILGQMHNTFERQTALQSAMTETLAGFSSLLATIVCTLNEEEKFLLHNFPQSVQYGFVSDDAGPRDLLHFLTGFKEWEIMSTYPA